MVLNDSADWSKGEINVIKITIFYIIFFMKKSINDFSLKIPFSVFFYYLNHTQKTFSILFPFLKLESDSWDIAKWDLFFVELLPGLSINSICSVYFLQVRPDMINYFWTPDIIIHDLIKYGPLPSLQRKSC